MKSLLLALVLLASSFSVARAQVPATPLPAPNPRLVQDCKNETFAREAREMSASGVLNYDFEYSSEESNYRSTRENSLYGGGPWAFDRLHLAVAQCLHAGGDDVDAKSVLDPVAANVAPGGVDAITGPIDVYHLLMQIDEGLGDVDNAKAAIAIAYNDYPNAQGRDSIRADYARYFPQEARADQAKINAQRQYDRARAFRQWKAYSPDQQTVIASNGGGMYDVQDGLPCHVSTFDSGPNYHQETWWYCNADGHYRNSYTFLNGKLKSTFTP